jgi:uncharacterized protein (TIGR00297 family)
VPGLTTGEAKRKLVHVAVGGFAFLLRFLTWPQAALMAVAAFAFNLYLLPRIGGRGLWRTPDHERGFPIGILLYPLAVLALILVFRHELWIAAAVWGILAFGDGMATVVGMAAGGPRLPWNPAKGWAGSLAFVLFGTIGASLLIAWTLRLPMASAASPRVLALTVPLAVLCALVESAPTTLDDNVTVPLAGAVVLPLLVQADPRGLSAIPEPASRAMAGVAINAAIATVASFAGWMDRPGAVSAVVIGAAITIGLGLPGLAVMVAFFVIGTAATKLGYRIKAARGIAQEKGGARGWRNAWANGGVPAFLALLAGAAGSGARPDTDVTPLLLTVAYAAAVATAAADTCSSEVGKAYGRRTFLITTLRPVPPGTEGAVSLEGTTAGLAGGALVAAVGAAVGLYAWPLAAVVASAGLLGSFAESVLGTVAERKGWMGNDLLNAFNTAAGAGIAVGLIWITGRMGWAIRS